MQKLVSALLIFSVLLSSSNQLMLENNVINNAIVIDKGQWVEIEMIDGSIISLIIESIDDDYINGIKIKSDGTIMLTTDKWVFPHGRPNYYKYINLEIKNIKNISILKSLNRNSFKVENITVTLLALIAYLKYRDFTSSEPENEKSILSSFYSMYEFGRVITIAVSIVAYFGIISAMSLNSDIQDGSQSYSLGNNNNDVFYTLYMNNNFIYESENNIIDNISQPSLQDGYLSFVDSNLQKMKINCSAFNVEYLINKSTNIQIDIDCN